ncbi:hypothetical protein QTH87_20480 [Variovorax sp. J22P168]|uniref:hypothetical protein n=1 Tax=Variovorax jilinensis TaxID=3053513 RepID=UPI002574D7C7|nr:hypothetical protein [Variovorax sp. J22P168]MDM0014832.1 hypothetical protein [Variovorax sp. J22P168]
MREDFEHWHTHEHFPERLGIPGFRRASRWTSASGAEGVFVMYELEDYEVLSSPAYLARLNAPTPWSTRMMPHHRNMVRSQSQVLETHGGAVARHALTVRLAPAAGNEAGLRAALKSLIETLPARSGLIGAHLLRHQTPPIAQTTEQKIRGAADQVADWVFVACGYELEALKDLAASDLSERHLSSMGTAPDQVSDIYSLSYSAVPSDVL